MRIGIVIGRIGGIDGVALETEKWIEVLRRMGHEVSILTGEIEAPCRGAVVLPELALSHPDTVREQDAAFFVQDADESELLDWLERRAASIERGILGWLGELDIELLVTENSSTLPCHLAMGMALKRVIEATGLPAIAHDHDFHWERGDRYLTRYAGIHAIVEECFPPDLPNLSHVVINSHCQDSLARERDMSSLLIPNVMDFDDGFGRPDEVNERLAGDLGLGEDDILLFQITRVVRRKGIETAIDLIDRLDDPRIRLIVTGHATDDRNHNYLNELKAQASRLDLDGRVLFASDRFANIRGRTQDGATVYSLSDAYARATAMTYFSTYEGFGNAFVEALAARVPIFVNNYKPVYWPDIGSRGFKTVQIEDGFLTEEAVERIRTVLTDADLRLELGEFNFELGRKYFSYEVLEESLGHLLPEPGVSLGSTS